MNVSRSTSRSPRLRSGGRVAAATTAVAVAVGAFSCATAAAAPTGPLPQFWMPNGNDSLLLNADAVAQITGTPGIGVGGVSSQFADSSKRVTPAACAALYQPAEAQAYPHATNVTTVVMSDENNGAATHLVQQSVVGYADVTSARMEAVTVAATWSRCAGAALTVKSGSGTRKNWTVGLPVPSNGEAVRVATNLGPGGVCERALTNRAAIIVDVMSCALGGGDPAGQAGAIAAKIRDHVAERDG
ncbi:sensor domain-containing protein [Mycolicibacterium sp. P1-18]|uniref:sensor domain-containing protein n=1 Tax=Mycolicibacterium sp. P1-18 TaxID=2024615 RepID=UPI0011F2C216|nr:sensor domain-containing protein [Mycolicibacterium sp. P1-18]KAA0093653.1 sensor domain-containing protein [Mycolicibacterium sp. P1-18]